MKPNNPPLPIGYWLKCADEAITQHVNQVLADHHLTRFDWQVLNTVYEAGAISKPRVFEVVQTFVDESEFEQIVAGFTSRGWMAQLEGNLELTALGKTGHEVIFNLQKEVRKRATQGVSQDEYAVVIAVLQRIVDNLETPAR